MINHIRTLLLNEARGAYGPDFPGEEYVPAVFRPRALTTPLQKTRGIIFGANPDRHMLNYRLRQLMPVLHETDLKEFVIAKDPRITYWPITDETLYRGAFGTTIQTLNNLGNPYLVPTGTLVPHEGEGRIHHRWHITVQSGTNIEVKRLSTPLASAVYSYNITEGLSNQIPLLGSSLKFVFRGGIGSEWMLEVTARPSRNTGEILATLQAGLTEVDENALFGTVKAEPYTTFRNLWTKHDKYSYQLGALLLALAYRTDAL